MAFQVVERADLRGSGETLAGVRVPSGVAGRAGGPAVSLGFVGEGSGPGVAAAVSTLLSGGGLPYPMGVVPVVPVPGVVAGRDWSAA